MVTDKNRTQKFINLTAGKSRYLEAGSGPHLFLVHGMGIVESADLFDPIFDGLAEHCHVVAPDILGFGLGIREVLEGPTYSLIVDQLRETMDVLGIEKASFVGHSAGGWMSSLLAYESPERIDKLVLMSSAGLNAKPPSGIHITEIPNREQIRETLEGEFLDKSRIDKAMLDRLVEAEHNAVQQPNALHSLDPLLHQMHTFDIRQRYLLHRRLPHIKASTLVIWGQGDFMDPYPTWTKECEALGGDMSKSEKPWVIPGARYVMLPTGHYPHWELPRETLELVLDFLGG